jgi:protein-S-isoprenylcysteine O-methyltransferase Ste14
MDLVGSGHKIALFTLPFAVAAVIAHLANPELLAIGSLSPALRIASLVVLAVGVVGWAWSVVLILSKIPRGELITTGPYAVVRHPLYTSVALLVLPCVGFLLGTWLWAFVGVALYVGSRLLAREEEAELALRFGSRWKAYCDGVWISWL